MAKKRPRRPDPPQSLAIGDVVRVVNYRRARRLGVKPPADAGPDDLVAHRLVLALENGTTRVSDHAQMSIRDIWYEVPLSDGWKAAYRLVEQAGALRIGELRIFPIEPDQPRGGWSGEILGYRAEVPMGGLPANVVKGVRVGAHLVDAQRVVAWSDGEALLARKAGLQRIDPFDSAGLWGRLGIRRPEGLTDSPQKHDASLKRCARAADTYVAALRRGERAPLQAVARALRVPYSAARDLIHQSRVRGILLPREAKRGRAEGHLSSAALDVLRAQGRKRR